VFVLVCEQFIHKSKTMVNCACCPACRPRYKRLVDNIYPSAPEDGLIRSEMEKLTYYAVSAPEKLDRIGDYLARRLTRDIARRRKAYVFVAMEALNQLLLACHAQQINLFVESVLKMVQVLLESDNYDYQELGTNSFEKFSKIEEVTASYHRQYDFFVSKFSAMCHCNEKRIEVQRKVQFCGVRGLRGIIRKTVSDELQVNIWEKQHMDKIISSLLYSMQNASEIDVAEVEQSIAVELGQPSALADESLRELLSRASFANVPAAISPALDHMDNHGLWAPDNSFAIKSFKIIMFSVQPQYSHMVVKMLLDHIDTHSSDDHLIKASLLKVLCAVAPIPASTAIGPSVIDVFNRLSHHLRIAAEKPHEEIFQNAVVETAGVLSSVIPDYQKLEAMTCYVNKAVENMADLGDGKELSAADVKFVSLLLHCLQQISKSYQTTSFSLISTSLLEPLLKISQQNRPEERVLAQDVVMVLFDKNRNCGKLKLVDTLSGIDEMGLISSNITKQEAEFLDRQLPNICHWLYESFCFTDSSSDNLISTYKCLSVLCLSVMSPDIIVELCRVVLAVQGFVVDLSVENNQEINQYMANVLSVTAASMLMLSHLSAVPEFQHYVSHIILERKSIAPQLLPCSVHVQTQSATYQFGLSESVINQLMFASSSVCEVLKGRSGYNVEKLNQPLAPILPLENGSADGVRGAVDVESINIEFPVVSDPPTNSAGSVKPADTITYDYLKQLVTQAPVNPKELIEKNQQVVRHILSVPFEQLVAEMPPDPCVIAKNLVNQIMATEDCEIEDDGLDSLQFPAICAF